MQFLLGEVDSMGILLYPQRMMKDGGARDGDPSQRGTLTGPTANEAIVIDSIHN